MAKKPKKPKKLTKKKLKKLEKREVNRQFKEWAEVARASGHNECAICKSTVNIQIHHIIPRQVKEFRFDQNNAIILCVLHHKFSNQISPHKNPFVFFLWLRDNRPVQFDYLEKQIKNLEEKR